MRVAAAQTIICSTLETLIHLVKCLKPNEIQFIKDFYKTKYNRTDNKRLRLFEIILKYQPLDNQKACRLLYKGDRPSAFCHLKKKLHEDLLNFILLNSQTGHDATYQQNEEILCRKTLLQGKILVSRGIYDQGIELLKEAGKIAERFEFPDLKLAAFDILRGYRNYAKGLNSRKYYNDQMDKALHNFEKILKAREIKFSGQFSIRHPSTDELNTNSAHPDISNGCVLSDSKRAYFWSQMNVINHCIQNRFFQEAKIKVNQLADLLTTEPALDCSSYHAEVYQLQARVNMYLSQYTAAILPARKSLELFGDGTYEHLQAITILFFAYYRSQYFQHAEEIITFAQHNNYNQLRLTQPWGLLKAALKFSYGNHLEAGKILNQDKDIKDCDKSWAIGQRLLELLNILELKDYDWFEYKIESFRKKLAVLKALQCQRLSTIYEILKTLRHTSFNFEETVNIHRKNLSLINSTDAACYWDPMGYEMVHVGRWMEKKVPAQNPHQ